MRRVLCSVILTLALLAPIAASADAVPAALDAATNSYFTAIATGDMPTLAGLTSPTFHVIQPDGKRLSFNDYILLTSTAYLIALQPSGNSQRIKSSSITDTGAKETVDTLHWYSGSINPDPMGAPGMERDYATHQLTWVKSSTGKWLVEEDHITAAEFT